METNTNILNYGDIERLAIKYNVPIVDVLLMALNRYGICANLEDKRIRFKLRPILTNEVYYLAICVNTFNSPFTIDDRNQLILDGMGVGQIFDIEKDTCDATYFRRAKTELTLNSNMRSQCSGCTFCGTYNLDPDDKVDMSDDNKIADFIDGYLKRNDVKDLSDLVRVTICTGCFTDEMKLVDHIASVHRVFAEYGFSKRIRYIGSQIRSEEAMTEIEHLIPFFSLSLTVECFSQREKRMRKEKTELNLDKIHDILSRSLKHGFSTNYLYILGLDELSTMEKGVRTLLDCINRFPIFQIMQNYVEQHENLRVEAAKEMDYYIQARKLIEAGFENTNLRPRSWENYRSLFYTTYQGAPYDCIRI